MEAMEIEWKGFGKEFPFIFQYKLETLKHY